MFRPSQALLYQQKRSLLSIHQPLPLSDKDAHKLLGLLKTSFRKHLDSEHGPPKSAMAGTSAKSGTPHMQGSRHTTQHFQSILTNPLIAKPQVTRGRPLPMDIFTHAVAKGMMTLESATNCLWMEQKRIRAAPFANVREGMKISGAGLVVLKWVMSNGWAEDLSFLANERFTGIFMYFLVAEGLQDVLWKWMMKYLTSNLEKIQTELRQRGMSGSLNVVFKSFLRQLSKAETRDSVCLDNAYLQLGRACTILEDLGFQNDDRDVLIAHAQKYLVGATIEGHSVRPQASEKAYATLLDTLPGKLMFHVGSEIQMAHLLLLHPTQPSVESALDVLSSWHELQEKATVSTPDLRGSNQLDIPAGTIRGVSSTTMGINLGFDATKFLLDKDRIAEADWVMKFLRETFPKELGEARQKELDVAAAEASSLEFLDSLRLT
ncbi:hypothetical protein HYALB_00012181 [Hymenoscyphus albidus]|uniref:Uncharacterized protein n=1 Tax=Hymenoscyphus albidus TaxID=595503 RepID=A0A9N9Q8D7_9HELO|nr:hypothetical protein HYALB_00012181 [Hymenoscyphus albidus]